MSAIRLPTSHTDPAPAAFSHEAVALCLRELAVRPAPACGYLSIETAERHFLLFIFQGRPYAAGLLVGNKATPVSITNLCAQVAALEGAQTTLSFHATDPVLLKCLLVFVQEEPDAHGPVTLINLERMIKQINEQACDALIVLERAEACSFFFFLGGNKTAAYWADPPPSETRQASTDTQLMQYLSRDSTLPVSARIYQSLATYESRDADTVSLEGLAQLFSDTAPETLTPTQQGSTEHNNNLTLRILAGDDAGRLLSTGIPCILGRKETDIVIADPMVSKRHAAIQCVNGRVLLVDLQSTNGTTLNGAPITQQELKSGDRIGIGQTVLVVETLNP